MTSPEIAQFNTGRLAILNVACLALQQGTMQSADTAYGSIETALMQQFPLALKYVLRDARPKSATMEAELTRLDIETSGPLPFRYALPNGYVSLSKIQNNVRYDVGIMRIQDVDRPVLKANSAGPIWVEYITLGSVHLLDGMTQTAVGLYLAWMVGRSSVSSAERARILEEYKDTAMRSRGSGAMEEYAADDPVGSPSMQGFALGGGDMPYEG